MGLLVTVSLGTDCRKRPGTTADPLCRSACASWVENCGAELAPCVDACWRSREGATREACDKEHSAYLGCLASAKLACEPSATIALVHGTAGRECSTEYDRYARCSAPCREDNVLRTGTRAVLEDGRKVTVMAWQVAAGCGPKPAPKADGAPPRSRCEAAQVCQSFQCPCPASPEISEVHACVDEKCADADTACRLVPLAVGHDVCRKR